MRALAKMIGSGVPWRSVRVPTFEPAAEDDVETLQFAEEFVTAVKETLEAVKESWAEKSRDLVDIEGGTSEGKGGFACIPVAHRHILGSLSEAFRMKKFLLDTLRISAGGQAYWSRTAADRGDSAVTNPFLYSVAALERRLLRKYDLTAGHVIQVQDALDPSWGTQIQNSITTWLWQLAALPSWCSRLAAAERAAGRSACQSASAHVDRAVIKFLQFRASHQRSGINVLPIVAQALRNADLPRVLPRTAEYAIRRGLDLGAAVAPALTPAPVAGDSASDYSDADSPLIERVVGRVNKGKGKSKGRGYSRY
jgi:hypothetical protein